MNNFFYIASAGAGKTTFIINEAIKKNKSTLITTYTIANTNEIKKKIIGKLGHIPVNIEITTWYDFLLTHGIKPYQGTMDNGLYEKRIGFKFQNEISGLKYKMKNGTPVYYPESDVYNHYFTQDLKIYSDKSSKFFIKCNEKIDNKIVNRINKIYQYIFIDEVQDLSGYDLEIIKLLFKSPSEITLVGDPRQTVYLTHPSKMHKKYQDGNIKAYFENELGKKIVCRIDEVLLNASHRNNKFICDYSSRLYLNFEKSSPCNCTECRNQVVEHEGIYIIKNENLKSYMEKYSPVQLRADINVKYDERYPVYNFGEAKGLTFDRVLIYPTKTITTWIKNNSQKLANTTKAKFYVALTRARYSVGILIDFSDKDIDKEGYCFNDKSLIGYNIAE